MIELIDYGFSDFFECQISEEDKKLGLIPARVTCVQKESYQLVSEMGENWGKLKGAHFYHDSGLCMYPAVGDFVLIKHNPIGEDIIYRVLERISEFSRINPTSTHIPMATKQVVASNFDFVFIMTSLNHDFNIRKLERYVATTLSSGATPVIVLTKADLCSNYKSHVTDINMLLPEVDVRVISAYTGFGMDKLKDYVQPAKTIVFLGSSGVGKSSLVNALANDDLMKVNGIREEDSRGRHTTTFRQLFRLMNGTIVIDTPGMRELGLWDASEGIKESFSDVEELTLQCRFHDCKHGKEPDCAIRAAIDEGVLSEKRFASYVKLLKETKYTERKAAYLRAKSSASKRKVSKNKHGVINME